MNGVAYSSGSLLTSNGGGGNFGYSVRCLVSLTSEIPIAEAVTIEEGGQRSGGPG